MVAYETLSETHWNAPNIEPNFTPNWVIDISDHIERKLKALRCYKSQIPDFPGSRSIEAVEALAKFRGTQAGFSYGEGMADCADGDLIFNDIEEQVKTMVEKGAYKPHPIVDCHTFVPRNS